MGELHTLEGQFLVGADGKTGIVRKYFLEERAGIKQVEGVYKYSGTWVATNLKINLPNRESHPDFPLWGLGYTPQEVYDLFWPQGWHFCSPPGKATATGRFGPYERRLWRHEFRQDDWDASMNAEALFWEHITPMITRSIGKDGKAFGKAVTFPRDCVEITRCRPFKFVHKVVNKWFDERTILIGDAAHVFPPFAGQGIGSGVRDAHQLAWRLAMLLRMRGQSQAIRNRILEQWALERRKSIDDAALFSLLNGRLCNEEPSFFLRAVLSLMAFLSSFSLLRGLTDAAVKKEREGMSTVSGAFHLKDFNGGARVAQIFIQSLKEKPFLSDNIFKPRHGVLTLLVISTSNHAKYRRDAQAAIEAINIDPAVLSIQSIVNFSPVPIDREDGGPVVYWPATVAELNGAARLGYDETSFVSRFGVSTKFAIVRPDFFVYACAKSLDELVGILTALQRNLIYFDDILR
jgi:2-polyprenyl-6-methoxyphenol hydroxylase-like FAD-dependent oxidoreductase